MKNSGTSIHAMKSTSNKYNMFGVWEFLYLNKLNLNKMNKIIGHAAEYTFDLIIGESEGIRQSIAIASEFATAGRNSVLIVGESGVGKEPIRPGDSQLQQQGPGSLYRSQLRQLPRESF